MPSQSGGKMFVMKTSKHILVAAVLGLGTVLSACASDEPIAGPVPEVGFQHLSAIQFNVAKINVANAYQSPMKMPNVEYLFPTSPAQAMNAWAGARLKAGGANTSAVAAFTIEDASVIETRLDKTEGLKGYFTYEPAERYDASAQARLTIQNPANGASGEVRVSAKRSIEVREDATLAEREQAWFNMIEALMADFDAQMEKQVRAHLMRWVMSANLK